MERRQQPRVRGGFPLKLGSLASATVRDISSAGVCCVTSGPLSPMTLVGLLLELPTGRSGEDAYVELPCEGVVVRCRVLHEPDDSRYETAILFKDLPEDSREILETFVDRRLNSPAG
ncbi:MAG: PilZ domain-containing protein [Planctomycetota bacterium]